MTIQATAFAKGTPHTVSVGDSQDTYRIVGPLGEVTILSLTINASVAPSELRIDDEPYVRIMDRFYLPYIHDPATTDAFFTQIASEYDQIIDADRNIDNLSILLRLATGKATAAGPPVRFLDFGCGTGLSVLALARLADVLGGVRITGFDRCARMRDMAHRRGLNVIPSADCAALVAAGPFDGAVASYVFHLGISDDSLRALHDSLLTGAPMVLNYHKFTDDALAHLDGTARAVGFRLVDRSDHPEHGSISVYYA